MAAASSSRARAGPPCEKSPLSVKGGSCCLAGIAPARDVSCVLCLQPGLAHGTPGEQGLGPVLCALGWARLCGDVAAGAARAARCSRGREMAPGATSPQSRLQLCPSARTAALGVPGPSCPRALR